MKKVEFIRYYIVKLNMFFFFILDIFRIVKEFWVYDVEGVWYIVYFLLDKFWIGYEKSIVLIDSEGNKFNEI